MLAFTEHGLRLVTSGPLGFLNLPALDPIRPPTSKCSDIWGGTVASYIEALRSTTCRRDLNAVYEQLRVKCSDISKFLKDFLTMPSCPDWTTVEFNQRLRYVSNIILREELGSNDLQNTAREIFRRTRETSDGEGQPPPGGGGQPSPKPGFDVTEFLRRYGVYIAVALAALLLLRGR